MSCPHYSAEWGKTTRAPKPNLQLLATWQPWAIEGERFARIEAWQKRRPPTHGAGVCPACGRDRFVCWLRTQRRELMAEGRSR